MLYPALLKEVQRIQDILGKISWTEGQADVRDWRREYELEERGLRRVYGITSDVPIPARIWVRRDGLLFTLQLGIGGGPISPRFWIILPKHGRIGIGYRTTKEDHFRWPKAGWFTELREVDQLEGPWWDDFHREVNLLSQAARILESIGKQRLAQENAQERMRQTARQREIEALRERYRG